MGDVGNIQAAAKAFPSGSSVWDSNGIVRLRALVLLSGGVRKTELSAGLGRSLLDLPLPGETTVLGAWMTQAQQLPTACAIRVLVSKALALPVIDPGMSDGQRLRIEHDKAELRGTGGVLRDLAEEFADDDWMLVASGNQVLLRPLESIVGELAKLGAPINLLSEQDGTSVGVQLIQCGALRGIRPKGYIDFKEQALPEVARHFGVRVGRSTGRTGIAIRTLDQYVRAVRTLSLSDRCALGEDVFAEEWSPTFSLVQPGANVATGAMVHDAIVMRGATVERGAVLVRALVCPGAKVLSGATVADAVVAANTTVRARVGGAA
jgi:hypothetical protein